MKALKSILLFCVALSIISCSSDDDVEPEVWHKEEVPNIIFDCDLGNCTDDAFALQALFAYQAQGKCKVVGIMQSRKLEKAKDLMDRFLHYYKADNVPLGLVEGEETDFLKIVPYYELADSVKPDGKPLFEPTGIPLSDRLPAWKLYRKLLSEAADNSITIVCMGMFTNLGLLLDSEADEYSPLNGCELIKKKVVKLETMGGCFNPVPLHFGNEGKPTTGFLEVEYNILGDVHLAKKVLEQWPGEVRMMPLEEGIRFPSIHDNIIAQYMWQKDCPIYQIYDRYNEWENGDVGQYLWDVVATLHPILGEDFFCCSAPGFVTIDDDGRTYFEVNSQGNTHIISLNATTANDIRSLLNKLAEFHP